MLRLESLISESKFCQNIKALQSAIEKGVDIMAILKSDAYGHDAKLLAPIAIKEGVRYIGLASLDEVQALVESGIPKKHLFLLGEAPYASDEEVPLDITYTIYTREFAERLNKLGRQQAKSISVHVKIDTGMHRLGVPQNEAIDFVNGLKNQTFLNVEGISTHMADAEAPTHPYTHQQLDQFDHILKELFAKQIRPRYVHASNSAVISHFKRGHYNLVRAGIGLFDHVMTLQSSVVLVKPLKTGEALGYDCQYVAPSDCQIAIVPAGYGDGISTAYGNRCEVLISGKRYPIVGKVCMDYLFVNLGLDTVSIGDTVTFLGQDQNERITCHDITQKSGLNPREVTCLLSKRVTRRLTD